MITAVIVKKWIQRWADASQPPATTFHGNPRTTVNVVTGAVTVSVTLCGHFPRREAIRRAAESLEHCHDGHQWSPSFIRDLYSVAKPRSQR